jgi:hypothetical protein
MRIQNKKVSQIQNRREQLSDLLVMTCEKCSVDIGI